MATGILDNIKEAVQASLNVSQMKNLTTPIIIDGSEYSTVETALNAINSKSVDVDDGLSAVSENPIQNKVITEEINKKLTIVDNMPTASAEFVGKQNLYVGNTTDYLNKGGIYECRSDGNDGYEWVLISTADVDLSKYKKIFTGTRAEWDVLTTTEKGEYDLANLTDDLAGGELIVSDEVTPGDLNPVTSNAVFDYTTPTDYAMGDDSGTSVTIDLSDKISDATASILKGYAVGGANTINPIILGVSLRSGTWSVIPWLLNTGFTASIDSSGVLTITAPSTIYWNSSRYCLVSQGTFVRRY